MHTIYLSISGYQCIYSKALLKNLLKWYLFQNVHIRLLTQDNDWSLLLCSWFAYSWWFIWQWKCKCSFVYNVYFQYAYHKEVNWVCDMCISSMPTIRRWLRLPCWYRVSSVVTMLRNGSRRVEMQPSSYRINTEATRSMNDWRKGEISLLHKDSGLSELLFFHTKRALLGVEFIIKTKEGKDIFIYTCDICKEDIVLIWFP